MNALTARLSQIASLGTLLAAAIFPLSLQADSHEGFETIFDGSSFDGWKKSKENPSSWKIEDGAFVTSGPRSHLFWDTDEPLKNFHLKLEVMTEKGSNGGIFFHTKYQEEGWPSDGFESQVNVSHKDWRKTGSVYSVADLGSNTSAKDGEWWTQEIIVEGNVVTTKINGELVLSYAEPEGVKPGEKFKRALGQGTIALQAHDPDSVVRYRNIELKRLP